jgi:hypothetical protein
VASTAKAPKRSKDRGRKLLGFISRGESYPLKLFMELTGWGRIALKEARQAGLRVVYHANTAVISGDDFNDWVLSPDRVTKRPVRGSADGQKAETTRRKGKHSQRRRATA